MSAVLPQRAAVRPASALPDAPQSPPASYTGSSHSFSFAGHPMTPNSQNTGAWLTFTYVSFIISVAMLGIGIWALPADLWVKGYITMASVFMLGSAFTLSKTVRDEHEAKRLTNRLEDAKAERLLMEVGRSA
jgi:hypothetical protein